MRKQTYHLLLKYLSFFFLNSTKTLNTNSNCSFPIHVTQNLFPLLSPQNCSHYFQVYRRSLKTLSTMASTDAVAKLAVNLQESFLLQLLLKSFWCSFLGFLNLSGRVFHLLKSQPHLSEYGLSISCVRVCVCVCVRERERERESAWSRLSFIYKILALSLEKAMAPHSSTPAWRIPGTGECGGLPSMGSHRVGHD